MMKIVTIIGARPQFIKAATVSRALQKHNQLHPQGEQIFEVVVHTGQHYDENMSKIFFEELQIKRPDYNLGVGSGSHGHQTGKMLAAIEEVFVKENPDLVLTYGDTNSTLAGALSASKLQILSAHVEAGLRSYNRTMPEEINRVVADHLANILFCPTETAVSNLNKEGIGDTQGNLAKEEVTINKQLVFNVGDVMYDSIIFNKKLASNKSQILRHLNLIRVNNELEPYCLATVHRQENTNDKEKLTNILEALIRVTSLGVKVIFPIHPRTVNYIRNFGLHEKYHIIFPETYGIYPDGEALLMLPPVGYLDMIHLEQNASCILTDSGGVQKEAFFLKVPCITLREETEWVETVDSGWNTLVGTNPKSIEERVMQILEWDRIKPPFVETKPGYDESESYKIAFPFGDGNAAQKIVDIVHYLLA